MTKIRLIYTMSIVLLLGLALSGCKKSFLDVTPVAAINTGSFYASQSDAEQAVATVYSQLCNITVWDRDILEDMGSIASDDAEAGGASTADTKVIQDVDLFAFTPTNMLPDPYQSLFRDIYFANLALEKLPQIKNADPTFINNRIAEVKFLRALNYFYLAQMYGGVPKVDHVLGSSEYNTPRASLSDIYAFVEQDLKDAMAVLPTKYDPQNIGRATKGAAQGLLAKVLLFESSYNKNYPGDARFAGLQNRYADALSYAEQVINSGNYRLVGDQGETYTNSWRGTMNGYRYIWTSDGDNSPESVFEIENVQDNLSWVTSRGSSMVNWTAARNAFNPQTQAVVATNYWGFNVPTHNLLYDFDPLDPRLPVTIHYDPADPGIPAAYQAANPNDSIHIGDPTFSGAGTAPGRFCKINYSTSPTKMYAAKYECSWEEFRAKGTWNTAPINNRILRYSDVVLVAAEAALFSGQPDKALTYVNMVRKRARMCGGATNTVPADLQGPLTFDQLVKERRVELALEGHRFFDLVRWNLAVTHLNSSREDGTPIVYESPKNDFYPLPQSELDISTALKQNPGW